jgi:hypothetical protein
MKKFILTAAFVLLLLQYLPAQPNKLHFTYSTFITIGYGNLSSKDVNDAFNYIVNDIRETGVPVNIQTKFGRTAMAGAGVMLNVINRIGLGLVFDYMYTPAYANYKDQFGLIKIKGTMNEYAISIKTRFISGQDGNFPFIVSPQLGFCHTSLSLSRDINFNDSPKANSAWEMTKDGGGLLLQATIGTSYKLGIINAAIEGGYRYSWVRALEQNEQLITNTNTETIDNNNDMDIGLSGLFSALSFSINF